MNTLYKRDSKGKIREWTVDVEMVNSESATIEITSGIVDGKLVSKTEEILPNKLYKCAFERAKSLASTKHKNKLKSGYVMSIEAAEKAEVLQKPMLAKRVEIEDVDSLKLPLYGQTKKNGVRGWYDCTNRVLYSREMNQLNPPQHIVDTLRVMAEENPDILWRDLELYADGYPVQDVVSMVKGDHEDKHKLRIWLFDCVHKDKELPFSKRYKECVKAQNGFSLVDIAYCWLYIKHSEIKDAYWSLIDASEEGLILRDPNASYKFDNGNHRSSALIKVKPIYSKEFKVCSVSYDWKVIDGERTPLVEFVCEDENSNKFKVIPNWTTKRRASWFYDPENDLSIPLTVEFRERTKKGIPNPARGIEFRDYE